jgi:hypothetical protein
MFIIWLAGLAVLPFLLTWIYSVRFWQDLRHPWIFVIVGVFALYVCAGLAGTWTLSGIGIAGVRSGAPHPRSIDPLTVRCGASVVIIIAVGCSVLWGLKLLFSKR